MLHLGQISWCFMIHCLCLQFANPDLPGYLGFANLPNQVHRKFVKKGFEFTLMIAGESCPLQGVTSNVGSCMMDLMLLYVILDNYVLHAIRWSWTWQDNSGKQPLPHWSLSWASCPIGSRLEFSLNPLVLLLTSHLNHHHPCLEKIQATVRIEASTVEIEERGVKLRLTVVDTPGFGDGINSTDWYDAWNHSSIRCSLICN